MENFIFNPPNKPAGLYHISDMPEKPTYCENYNFMGRCDHTACLCEDYKEVYERQLTSVISSSILVENEKETKWLIEAYCAHQYGEFIESGKIYQLECKVEKICHGKLYCCGFKKECKNIIAVVSPIEEKPKGTLCDKCDKPVGNPVFTVCDNCWDNKEQPKQEEIKRPDIKEIFGHETTLVEAHGEYVSSPKLFKYVQALDNYIDYLESKSVSLPHQESSEEEQIRFINEILTGLEEVSRLSEAFSHHKQLVHSIKSKFHITRKQK